MSYRRRLIPLLTAVLVIQGLVAVLPHTHDHGPVEDGRSWQATSSPDGAHHCLACSAHAPIFETAAGIGYPAGSEVTSPVSDAGSSSDVSAVPSSIGPRGPPRIV